MIGCFAAAAGSSGFSFGNALQFDGTDDFVAMDGLASSVNVATGSIGVWVKPDATTGSLQQLISITNSSSLYRFELAIESDGSIRGYLFPSPNAIWYFKTTSTTLLTVGQWSNIIITQNGTAPIIYVDGVSVSFSYVQNTDETIWLSSIVSPNRARMGCRNFNGNGNSSFLDGTLDDIFITSDVVTSTQAISIYNSGNGNDLNDILSSFISWYKLNESGGNTIAIDSKGNNNGTLNNFTRPPEYWIKHHEFNPLDLNPVLYLRADKGVTESDGLVSSWANQGIGTTDAEQGTGSAQPTFNASGFGVNSLPYLDFDGSSDFMSLGTEYSGMTEHTIFTVHIRDNSLTDSQIIIADGDASGDSLLPRTSLVHRYRNNSLDVTYGDGTDFRIIRSSETFTSTTNVYITMDFKATGVALNTMQVNGTDLTENTIVGTATEIGGAPTPTYISQWGASGGAFFDGKIAEILVFDYVLTSSQITSVTNFLKSKYGIS